MIVQRPSNVWRYGRDRGGAELAVWDGSSSLPLACHFHREIQVTAVLAGRRRFRTAAGLVTVNAGEAVILPPELPHQALGLETAPTLSLNFYLTSEAIARRQPIIVQAPHWLRTDMLDERPRLRDWVHDVLTRSRQGEFDTTSSVTASVLSHDESSIGEVASTHGMSREGFIRQFHRLVGMTPHAYRLAVRLNHARALLAADVTPAQAAAAAGFADQSHLGRRFRLAFGATPAAYRCAVRA